MSCFNGTYSGIVFRVVDDKFMSLSPPGKYEIVYNKTRDKHGWKDKYGNIILKDLAIATINDTNIVFKGEEEPPSYLGEEGDKYMRIENTYHRYTEYRKEGSIWIQINESRILMKEDFYIDLFNISPGMFTYYTTNILE